MSLEDSDNMMLGSREAGELGIGCRKGGEGSEGRSRS